MDARPDGVGDRVGDGRRDRRQRRLADALGAVRTEAGARFEDHAGHLGHVHRGRDQVFAERRRDQHAVAVDQRFAERIALALRRTALDLALDGLRVDALADIVRADALEHGDLAGLGVDRQLDGVAAEGVVGVHPALAGLGVDLVGERRAEHGEFRARDAFGSAQRDQFLERHRARRVVDHEGALVGQVDRVGRDAERLRGARQQPRAHRLGGVAHGVAGHIQRARRRRRAGQRGDRRIRVVDGHVVEADAEDLGGDLAQRRDLTGADVGDARTHHHGAVDLDADPGFRGVVQPGDAAVGLLVAGDAPAGLERAVVGRLLAERGPGGVHATRRPDRALDRESGRDLVAGLEEVAPAQLHAIHAERLGDLVHLLLVGDAGLRRAEAPEGAGVHVVGRHRDGVEAQVVDAVGPRAGDRRIEQHVGAEIDIGTGVGGHVDLERGDLAVLGHAGLVVQHEGVALAVAEERILARITEPDRAPRRLGQEREVDLDGDVLLAAEAAADQRAADAHLVVRHADGVGDEAEVLDHLGRHADVDDLVLVDPGEPDLGLEEGVLDELGAEAVLDDDVGRREARLDVALADLVAGHPIVDALHDRRARRQRLGRVEHAGQRLELVVDQRASLGGARRGLGGDQREWLAVVAHPFVHQDLAVGGEPRLAGLAGHVGRQQPVGQVGAGNHRDDAVERPRLFRVEPLEARARQRAAQHLGVQHVRHDVVAGIGRRAEGLARRVGAHQRPADLAVLDVGAALGLCRVGHGATAAPRSMAAASRTASNTLV